MAETEVDSHEDRRLRKSFLSLQSLSDFRAALDPHQHFIGGEDGHALYDLPDGVFIPFRNRLCSILYGLLCLLHTGADAVCVGAALQNFFLLFLERSLLGQNFRKLCVAGFFILGINGFCQKTLELLVELPQAFFNVSEAHGLTLYRQKL